MGQPKIAEPHPDTGGKTPDRIIDSVLALWERQGSSGLSVRTLTQAIDATPSSVHYHFGSFERMLDAVQRAAIDRAERWCAACLDEIAPLTPDPEEAKAEAPASVLAPILATLIDRWCAERSRLAFAWRECQLLAGRSPAFRPLLRRWEALWRDFWTAVCARCGHPDAGPMTAWLFDGESLLHMACGRRLTDRACLDELCRGWEGWLNGRPVAEGPWRRQALREARPDPAPTPETDAATLGMTQAAADIVAEQGAARLTHRAVATRAGVSLGMVSYRFRTSADLLRTAFEEIYRRMVPPDEGRAAQAHVDAMLAEPGPEAPPYPADPNGVANTHMLALTELALAVARDTELSRFAHQLRYQRGRTSRHYLRAIRGGPVSGLDAALFSSLASGEQRAETGLPEKERQALFTGMTRAVARLIGREAPLEA